MPGIFTRFGFLLLLTATASFAQTGVGATAAAADGPSRPKAATINVAGVVDFIEGDVRVFDANRTRREIKVRDLVNEGDSVVTGGDGELHLNMQDGGYLAVRPNSTIKIVKYQANGEAGDTSIIGLLKGSLRSVTGFIGKFNARDYKVRTPTATIGVRGTDHETYVVPPNSATGEAGTYEKVNVGGTFIQTPQGRADVAPNQSGFAPHGGKAAPRLLAAVPGFFKATRNERLVEKHRDLMQPKLQQLREQRKQQFLDRRAGKTQASTNAAAGGGKNAEERQQLRQEKLDARKKAQVEKHKTLEEGREDHEKVIREGRHHK